MTVVTVGPQPLDPLGVALGVQFEPYPLLTAASVSPPVSQIIFGTAVYALGGSTITGIKMRNATAAAGTLPTTARFGLADSTGKILAISANVNALASWATGVCAMPFAAPLILPYSGLYFACFVVNGTWGTTQPQSITANATTGATRAADGANPPPCFQLGGQTDLPAVGASIAPLNTSALGYYLPLY